MGSYHTSHRTPRNPQNTDIVAETIQVAQHVKRGKLICYVMFHMCTDEDTQTSSYRQAATSIKSTMTMVTVSCGLSYRSAVTRRQRSHRGYHRSIIQIFTISTLTCLTHSTRNCIAYF